MHTAASILFRNFLQQCPEEKKQKLLSLLAPMQREEVLSIPIPSQPTNIIISPYNRLDAIHPSWIEPRIRSFAKPQISLFLSALNPSQAATLAQSLSIITPLPHIKTTTKKFLRKHLFSLITQRAKKLLPIECLPSSPCNALLNLSLFQFLKLFNYWGLHDLAYELQFVIDKSLLVELHKALDQNEWNYLQNLMTQPERFHFNRMYIEQWNYDPKVIRNLIHQRGINRLSKTLYNEHPSLLWHIAHILDIGRGTLLTKYFPQENPGNLVDKLKAQSLELITFLTKNKLQDK